MPKRSDSNRFRSPSISLLTKKPSNKMDTTPVLNSKSLFSSITESTIHKMPKRSDSNRFRSPSISLLTKKPSNKMDTTPVLNSKSLFSSITEQFRSESHKSHLFGSNLELSSTGNVSLINERLNSAVQQTPIVTQRPTTSNSGGGVVSSGKNSFVNKHLLVQRRRTIHDIINLDLLSNIINSTSPKKYDKRSLSSSITSDKKLDLDELSSLKASRDLLLEASVLLLNQYGKQERHLFLFTDLLIIAKQKNENNFKIKYRVWLSDIWLGDCFDAIYWQYKANTSIVIGWPPATNYILDFRNAEDKHLWLDKLKNLTQIQKEKEENSILNIKISYNTDNSGTTAPTKFSQCYTKTVQVRPDETALHLVARCKSLFNLDSDIGDNRHQLWLKISANEPLIPLIGHEFPYAIKMNSLRETGATLIEENDTNYKFVLIDNKKYSNDMQTKSNAPPKGVSTAPNDTDKLYRLRKKMFWNKNSSSNRNLDSLLDLDGVLLPKKNRESKTYINSIRSNSLHHVYQGFTETSKSSKKSISTSSSIATSTLRPLYHKLKRAHLFGVKLEKICGPYSATNCRLPAPIMSLMEKVASEGINALMIFRKSASAKLKKTYRDKIDSNQAFDYDEMNVHIAALLLKEFLRDYPDGIIDYRLFNDCVKTLSIKSQDQQLKAIKVILNRLPKWNYVCLRHFVCLFQLIACNSSVNKMDVHNISVCVAPSLFHKIEKPSDVETNFKAIAFVEFVIERAAELFGADTLCLLSKRAHVLVQINSDASKSSESLCQPTRTPHQFVFDADDSSVYEASTDDDHHHQDNCNDDDQDIVCQAKKNKLFTKRNLFKIKSNSKNFHKVKANKHDLSSNTLSVDSGLSVPTTTNSDPESEKSLKKPEESQLKRQKRMLALHPDSEHTACYDLTSHRSSMAQTGTELMDTFLRHNSKRFSLKSMAPLAPHKVDEQQCHSLPHSSTKSTVTESKTSRAHASRKSIVRLRLDEAAIGGRVFESSVQVGCGEVAEMGWCADESPKRRHSSMVYVSVAQSKQFNSKSLVADLFSEEMSPTRSMVKRSLSLKNDEEEAKPLKIAVSTKQSFVGVKRSGVRVGPGAEQHRLSVDSGGCGKARAMDDNNNDSGSRSKCLDELELAGVAWSVPNIRKQFERASESKRLVESLASGRRKTINVESGLADNNRFVAHRTTYI